MDTENKVWAIFLRKSAENLSGGFLLFPPFTYLRRGHRRLRTHCLCLLRGHFSSHGWHPLNSTALALCAEVPCRLQTGHRKPSKSELNTVVPLANFSNPCVSFLTFAVPRYYCGELSDPRPTSLSTYCVCSADYCDAYLTHDSVRRQKLMQLRSEWKFLSTLNSPQFESSMMQVTSTR